MGMWLVHPSVVGDLRKSIWFEPGTMVNQSSYLPKRTSFRSTVFGDATYFVKSRVSPDAGDSLPGDRLVVAVAVNWGNPLNGFVNSAEQTLIPVAVASIRTRPCR